MVLSKKSTFLTRAGVFCRILVTQQTGKLQYHHNKPKMPVINSSPPFTFGLDPFRIVEEPMFGSSSNQYACQVCLDTATPGESVKFHRHHSSFFYKKWHLEQGLKELKCPTCKIVHPIEPDVERKVVFMTSSTLHNVFLDPAVRLPFHLDVESPLSQYGI